MAWEARAAGSYYYRKERRGGKVCSVYVGGGWLGELAAKLDAGEQARRAAQDAQRRLQRAQDRAVYRDIDAQYGGLRALVWAALTAAGYYQHKREWRKMGKQAAQLVGPVSGDSADRARLEQEAAAKLDALVKRINGPKPSRADLDALRGVLALGGPGGAVLTVIGSGAVLDHVIDKYTDSAATRLVMRADADRMAKTLGRDSAPPLEQPLINHIVLCWVRLQMVERDHTGNTAGSHSRDSGAYWDRRLTEAQRRYLRAVNLLAKLRNLAPGVQVNVANQQVVMNGPNGKGE